MRDDLPHAMRETARRLEPDVVRLAAGGVSRGTRMRRVQRVVQVLGSVVAVGVVFAGVVVFGARHDAGSGGVRPGAGGVHQGDASGAASVPPRTPTTPAMPTTPTTSPPTPPTPPSTPLGTPTPTGGSSMPTEATPTPTAEAPQISGNDLIATMKARLAGTGVTGASFVPDVSGSQLTVRAQLSARHDIGFLGIVVSNPRDFVPPPGQPKPLPDGSVEYLQQEPESLDGQNPAVIRLVLVRPDGSSLAATETDGRDEKGPAEPGAPLLLTASQISTLLDSADWDAAIAAADAGS